MKFGKLLAAGMLVAASARAYVTSAIMEYTCDDKAGFYLNGSCFMEKSPFAPFDYAVLSTSDGTLPMELFNPYGDNLLAVVNYDTKGGSMQICYRFTIHQSDGDPIVIWSIPEQSKFLHLHKEQPAPEGWERPGFDDSSWAEAVKVSVTKFPYTAMPRLYDPAFSGFMGTDAYVPILSHVFNAACTTADHNHFISHFRFPDHPAKVQALMSPSHAVYGQNVAVRLIPGPDTSEYTQFNIMAWLPTGLDMVQVSKGGQYDAKLRRMTWSFGAKDLEVRYAKLGVKSIAVNGGWPSIESMIGGEKPGHPKEQLNIPQYMWDSGATMSPNRPSWFKMETPNINFALGRPLIKGVIFHTHIRLGGTDTQFANETDFVRLNYSINGTTREALKDDVIISRCTNSMYWFDGYYDATEDRHWTWEDLARLMTKIEMRPKGSPDKDLIADCVVTVKYYNPSKASPYFYAKVTEPSCKVVQLQTGIFRVGSPMVSSDPVDLRLNDQLCAPTPVPTIAPTPEPPKMIAMPTPEPPKPTETPGPPMVGDMRFHLGCLSANPEPFNYAGTFVSFCQKKEADITLTIFSEATRSEVRQLRAGTFRANDNNQIFFNALDDDGKLLPPGNYIFELVGEKNGHKEVVNGTFQMKRGK
jgi:hypothetical protein